MKLISNLKRQLYLSVLFAFIIVTGISHTAYSQDISINFTVSDYIGNNISCHGASDGSVSVSVTGLTPPYTYLWNTGITTQNLNNIPAGNYYVTITDSNNVTATDSVLLTEPSAIGISFTSQVYNGYNISVYGNNDGNINTTVTGGTTPYTSYNWSNGSHDVSPQNLAAGIYTLTVTDANSCAAIASDTLTQPRPLHISSANIPIKNGGFNVSCNGGSDASIQLSICGGARPYWGGCNSIDVSDDTSNTLTFSSLTSLTYMVHIFDANGASIDTLITTITQPSAIAIERIIQFPYANGYDLSCYYCADGAIKIIDSGGVAPHTYQLHYSGMSTGDTLLSSGTNDSISNIGGGYYDPMGGGYYVVITDANGCSIRNSSFTISQPPYYPLSLTMTSTGNSCYGDSTGSMALSVDGGTPPYRYLWSNGATTQNISNLPAGDYGVTVIDARNDSLSDTLNVIPPAAIAIAFINSVYNGGYNISTFGGSNGSPTVNVTGGTQPIESRSWSSNYYSRNTNPSTIMLPADIYTYSVTDANGCALSANDTLTQPPPLKVDSIITPLNNGAYNTCNGGSNGSVRLPVTGGVRPYHAYCNLPGNPFSESWYIPNDSNSLALQNIPAGNFSIYIVDANGATFDTTFNLTQPANGISAEVTQTVYSMTVVGSTNVSCYYCADGTIKIAGADGVAPYTYQLYNPNDSLISTADSTGNLAGGDYTAIITDSNGCFLNTDIGVVQPAYVPLSISMNNSTTPCYGDSLNINLSISGGTPPFAYQWSNGATTQNLTNVPPITYSVTVIDSRHDSVSSSITPSQPPAISINTYNSIYNGGYNISVYGYSNGYINATPSGGTRNAYWPYGFPPYGYPVYYPYSYSWRNANDSIIGNSSAIYNLPGGIYKVTVTDGNGCSASAKDTLIQAPPLKVDSISSPTYNGYNISCNGGSNGSINFHISGGVPFNATPPYYQYTWTDGQGDSWNTQNIQNAPAGTYTVTVTDANGAQLDTSITLTQPNPLSDMMNVTVYATLPYQGGGQQGSQGQGNDSTYTSISCRGCKDGSIGIDLFGGAAPYSYLWVFNSGDCSQQLSSGDQITTPDTSVVFSRADSISNLSAGNYYIVVIDANGCQFDDNACLSDGTQNQTWSRGGNSGINPAINFIGTQDSADFAMRTNDTERVRVAANGNVGIGTSTPQAQLDISAGTNAALSIESADSGRKVIQVNQLNQSGIINFLVYSDGRVFAREVTIDAPGVAFPDYVFAPGFKLRSLKDLEKFISKHKHLPDIPTAAEVDKGGLSLGQMQEKLLEKIEELSIYVIDLNKKDIELNKKILELQSKNEELEAEMKNNHTNK